MLPCGTGTLLEKQIRATSPSRVTLWVRPGLEDFCRRVVLPTLPCPGKINEPLDDEPALVFSGRTLHMSKFEIPTEDSIVIDTAGDMQIVRQVYTTSPGLSFDDVQKRTDRWMRLLKLPRMEQQARMPDYVWDLIKWNEEAIVADAFSMTEISQPPMPGPYHLVEEKSIWLGKNVKLDPGCVLDASKGPIVLATGVSIGANAVIQGPCSIGSHSQISPLSTIRAGTSVGPMCKMGGEISSSIVIGYSNKPHEGFLGDSYVGEWVNLGAGTTTSNLKNTYGQITMPVNGKRVSTGRRFLGSVIGDHSKIAIGTRLMTGTYIGFSCMVGTSQYPPRFIPSFTFLTDDGPQPYRMDKAIETMKSVFTRRNRGWTNADAVMNRFVAESAKSVEKLPED